MHKLVNGIKVDLTAEEIAEVNARNKSWNDGSAARKLVKIRQMRLGKLKETDYLANSDLVMPDNIKTWRQNLRNLPQDNSTEDEYDVILAQDEQGQFTNVIWSKP